MWNFCGTLNERCEETDVDLSWPRKTHPASFLLPLQGAIYGMAQSIPDRSIVSEISWGFLDCLYSTEDPRANGSHINGNGKANWGGRGLLTGPRPKRTQGIKLTSWRELWAHRSTLALLCIATLNGRKKIIKQTNKILCNEAQAIVVVSRPEGEVLWPCGKMAQGDWTNDWFRIHFE